MLRGLSGTTFPSSKIRIKKDLASNNTTRYDHGLVVTDDNGAESSPSSAVWMKEDRSSNNTLLYDHEGVYHHVIDAFNKADTLPSLIDLFEDSPDATFCDPYPNCVRGKDAILEHLQGLSSALTDAFLIAMPASAETRMWTDHAGGFWVPSLTYSVGVPIGTGSNAAGKNGCLVGSSQYIQWQFNPIAAAGSEKAAGGTPATTTPKPKLLQLSMLYDERQRFEQVSRCASMGLVPAAAAKLMLGDGRELPGARETLAGLFDGLFQAEQACSGDEECWAAAFADVFADSEPRVEQCDPAPTACVVGKQKDVRARFEGFGAHTAFSSQLRLSGVFVSKGFAWALTTYTSANPPSPGGGAGCLSSHLQMQSFELSEVDPSRAKTMMVWHGTGNSHNCDKWAGYASSK